MSVAVRARAIVTLRPSRPATNQTAVATWRRTTHSSIRRDAARPPAPPPGRSDRGPLRGRCGPGPSEGGLENLVPGAETLRMKVCPHCAEELSDQATVCPHCHKDPGA